MTRQIFVGKALGLSGLILCDATGEKMSLTWALGKVPPSPETFSAGTKILEYSVKGNWLTEKMAVVWIPERTV